MSKSTIKKLIIFLAINLLIAIYLVGNFFFKANQSNFKEPTTIATNQPQIQTPTQTVQATAPEPSIVASTPEASVTNATPVAPVSAQPPVVVESTVNQASTNTVSESSKKICISMGPFTIEEKATMDFILKKNQQSELAKSEKHIMNQIFWNLGKNKTDAEKLFKKQKEGAMADAKFVLTQNQNKDWVVNIVKIPGSDVVAEKLTKELEEKAQRINAGGKWEYIALPEGYFFTFENFGALNETTIKSIDIMLKPTKDPC